LCQFYRASYASTILAVIMCLSVYPSVRLSQIGVVQRWLYPGSH